MFTAVSYNLHAYGKSSAGTRRRQHHLLQSLQPDVICLQEIYARGADQAELDQLTEEIAGALGMHFLAVPAVHSDCHLAVLWQPDYRRLSTRAYSLNLWHGLGVVRLDIGADVPLTVATAHIGPWDPGKQLADAYTLTGQLNLTAPTILGADWNSFGADPAYDPEPDWAALPPEWIPRHVRWSDNPDAPPGADRRPAQLMHRSGWHDAAPTLAAPWQPTGGHHGGWSRREDIFWTNQPHTLRNYRVIDTAAARDLSDHLPILTELDPNKLTPAETP